MVKLRAFVAGSGDLRRVEQIVSEVFTGKKQALPALTTVQVGALPLEGAQVVLESIAEDRRSANPAGLVFLSARPIEALLAAGKPAGDIVQVTCFLTSLDGLEQVRGRVAETFPAAAADFVQLTRLGSSGPGEATNCEAVARGAGAAPEGSVAMGSKVVFSGLQMAFRDQEADVRLAFDRLNRAVSALGGSMDEAFVSVYPLTRSAAEAVRTQRGIAGPPLMLFEGLPALDAAVGVEVAAPAH